MNVSQTESGLFSLKMSVKSFGLYLHLSQIKFELISTKVKKKTLGQILGFYLGQLRPIDQRRFKIIMWPNLLLKVWKEKKEKKKKKEKEKEDREEKSSRGNGRTSKSSRQNLLNNLLNWLGRAKKPNGPSLRRKNSRKSEIGSAA